ncbi:hypothetical protein CKA32_006031 [Geitlerinema sp. FC II]|nr:hypothetical protein CKA32_006031 [Geitlerinema sp. FC II]
MLDCGSYQYLRRDSTPPKYEATENLRGFCRQKLSLATLQYLRKVGVGSLRRHRLRFEIG